MSTKQEDADGHDEKGDDVTVTEIPRPYRDLPRERDEVEPFFDEDVEVREFPVTRGAAGVEVDQSRPRAVEPSWIDIDYELTSADKNFDLDLVGIVSQEPRYLTADAPACVCVGETFHLIAGIAQASGYGPSSPLGTFSIPRSGMNLTIVLSADRPIRMHSPGTRQLKIFPNRDATVEFVGEAAEPGLLTLELHAFCEGGYLGELSLQVAVTRQAEQRTPPRRTVEAQVEFAAPFKGAATLSIDYTPGRRVYRFGLVRDGSAGHWADLEADLSLDLNQVAAQITATLNTFAKGGVPRELIPTYLESIGSRLWAGLPPALGELLSGLEDVTRLTVVSRRDQLPWELMWSDGQFVADRWSVNRWFYGSAAPSSSIGSGGAAYVLPAAAPTQARNEVRTISRVYPAAAPDWSTVRELLAGIKAASFGMLHVASHNTADFATPAGSYISLDRPFDQLLMGPHLAGSMKDRKPLVFVNACASAAATPTWFGTSSWADLFVQAGAGAFIGSLWEVRDGSASSFAEAFYASTHRGSTLGEAFQAARRTISDPTDPTRLAYTFYGHPDACLATR